jgi:hypothetical protein
MRLETAYEEHSVIGRLIGSMEKLLDKVKHVYFIGESLMNGEVSKSQRLWSAAEAGV